MDLSNRWLCQAASAQVLPLHSTLPLISPSTLVAASTIDLSEFSSKLPFSRKPSLTCQSWSASLGRCSQNIFYRTFILIWGFVYLQCGRPRFDPWVGKIPWRRKWQPTPVLLPGKSHGQRSWGRLQSMGSGTRLDTTEWLHFLSLSILIWVKFCLCNSLMNLHYNKNWILHSKGKSLSYLLVGLNSFCLCLQQKTDWEGDIVSKRVSKQQLYCS